MSEQREPGLETIETDLVDTTATVTDSDNSQSSAGAPPDITQIGSSFDDESEAYCSDPPDLNPEDADLDTIEALPKTVSVTDTLEITDSNGPPDLTNSDDFDYGSNQEVLGLEESDFPDVIEAEACNPETGDSVDIENQAFLSANSPQDSSPFISESGTDISLAQEVSKNYLPSRYSESRFSESLLAVAPDDILPVRPGDILPIQGQQQVPLPVQQFPIKRGPGRPRKDGLDVQPRKKTKVKSNIKASHNIMAHSSACHFAPMEVLDNNSQGSSSLGEISSEIAMETAPFGMSEEESNSMYQLEEGTDIPLRVCSLCNLAERSLLGQGDICRYEPTPGFNPFKQTPSKLERKFSPDPEEKDGEKGPKPLTWRRNRGPIKGTKERSKSPRRYPHNWDDDSCFVGNELSFVGFTDDVDLSQIFEVSGHVWSHHCCAAWSEGVVQSCNLLLLYVDKAVFGGISQKCNYCHRYGATIKCRIQTCDNMYHYPCAAAHGCFQDIKTLTLLCPDHTSQAHAIAAEEALCVMCDNVGNVAEQLFCTSCGHHYHSNCMNPIVSLTPEVRAGWQCPDCKVCQKCRKAGDDNKMLVCDTCDKGYHTYCLKPVMTTIPKNGWKCKNCRVCTDCESRTPGSGPSSRWHHNYSVCDSCYQQRNKGLFCPVCRKAYRQFTSNAMLLCTSCKKHVHRGCDEAIELYMDPALRDQQPEYVCITCKNGPEMDLDLPPYSFPGIIEENSEEFMKASGDEFMIKDSEYDVSSMGDNSSHLDNNFFINEDSVSSMDIDISVIEKGAQQLGQPSYSHPEHSTGGKGGKLSVMSRKKLAVGKTRGRPPGAEAKKRTSSFSERKRGAKPKMKNALGTSGLVGTSAPVGETKSKDDDDDDDHPQTLIMADAEDFFVLNQDVCKSCGSFGKGEEGKLIVCTQCGQCYHPYCVSVKVTKVVLQKGWRCLDCTVCEGCGKPHDEGRLILCDECDISYHIYCLEPPLDHVPTGNWKCKWCVKCMYCGTTSPGFGCQWQNNYTQCGPCNSKICCPICHRSYCEEELIIQCLACDRWLHALCDGLRNEDETERAADFGYHCKFCRPRTGQPGPLPPLPPPSPPTPEELRSPTPPLLPLIAPQIREPEIQKRFHMDGVYLNQSGINHIQSLMLQVQKVRKPRRPKKITEQEMKAQLEGPFKAPSIARMLSTQSSVDGDEELDDLRMSMDSESQMTFGEGEDTLLSPTGIPTGPLMPGEPAVEEKKKRKRNVVGLGVGGFIARQRHRAPNKSKVAEGVTAEGEEVGEDGTEKTAVDPEQKQRRKRQARKKSQLENSFPSYLQEAFFGKEILDKSKQDAKQGLKIDPMSDEEPDVPLSPKMLPGLGGEPAQSLLQDIDQTLKHSQMLPPVSVPKDHKTATNEDNLTSIDHDHFKDILPDDLSELPPDEDLFSIIGPELTKDDESFEDGNDPNKSELPANLDSMLSPNNLDMDKLLSDSLAHMDGQTVEDIFKGVLQDDHEGQPKTGTEGFPVGVSPNTPEATPGNFPGHIPPMAFGPSGFGPGFSGKPGHPPFQDPRYHHEFQDHSNWPPGTADDEDEGEGGNSRRKILKWECDEELGSNATISAILYCNMNHPELRTQFPEWNERVKRIAKLWRSLSADEKQPYLLQARKNRQNTKVTKAYNDVVSNDLKKQKQKEKAAAAAAAMGPPLPPGPLPPFPQSAEGSPITPGQEMRSPLSRTPSNPQIAEGSSPGGQIPAAGIPSSPIQRAYPGPQPDPLQRMQHVGPQDPYAQPAQTPRPIDPNAQAPGMDPYAHPPATPRSQEQFGPVGPNARPQTIGPGPGMGQKGDPFAATATDPFEQSPTGPRTGQHPGTPQQSPSHPHWPGVAQESHPFAQSPVKQLPEGLQSPSAGPKPPEGFVQPMSRPGPQAMIRPPFSRQASQGDPYAKMPQTPIPPSSQQDDPYAFPPSTPRAVTEPYRPPVPRMSMPQPLMRHPNVPMQQGPGGEMRPHFPQRQMLAPGMPQVPPGAENYPMQRPQFRPQMAPGGQMVRSMVYDPYSQPPGTPHPGMDPSSQPSVVPDRGGVAGDQKQQLREILANKTKINKRKKEQWPEGAPGAPGPYSGEERFPGPQVPGMPHQERWPGKPMMGPPLHPQHMRPEMQIRMRGPFPEGMRPGMPGMPIRQQRPVGPMPGKPGPFSPTRPMHGQAAPQSGQPLSQEQIALYHQHMQQHSGQRPIHHGGQVPVSYGQQGVPLHPGQPPQLAFDPSKSHEVPSSVGGIQPTHGPESQLKGVESGLPDGTQKEPGPRPDLNRPKLSVSSTEEKTEEHDNIDDFLDLDGSFDILKYADPELNLDLEGKTIFDDLEDEPEHNPEVKGQDEATSSQNQQQSGDKDGNKSESKPGIKQEKDFQTKFLEFSQKKKDDQTGLSESEKSKQEINQIAALLKSEQVGHKLERRDSQKSDGSGKDHTGPSTPSGGIDPMGNLTAPGMAVGPRHSFPPGIHSPMHQTFPGTAVPSPGSATGSFQQGPGTPGLVSPKVMPSPRSSAPSPKTPNALSPFSQQPLTPNVQSPFSQPTNSPFSPSVTCTQPPFSAAASTSAPQSPYGASVSQPPFGLPTGGLPVTYGSQTSPMPAQSPGQRSPRGAITPTNQYMQGTYVKPTMQVSQPGATLGPAPNSVMYGQTMMGGPRPPYTGPPAGVPGEGFPAEGDPSLHGAQAGVRMPGTSVQSTMPNVSVPYQPGQEGMPRFPSQQPPMRGVTPPGFPGQPGMPGYQPAMRMRQPSPGMTSPGLTTPTSQTPSIRPPLLQDQPLLIQDLLEKEKQEQQRQAQQQAMMHRREGSMEGIMGTGQQQINVPPGMAPYRPRMLEQSAMQRHTMDPNWMGTRMYAQPPEGQPPFHVRMPGQQMGQGPRLPTPFQGQGMGPQGIPPPPQPPIPPMHGEISPEIDRQHVQYEDWLMKHNQYLEMQVKALDTQIAKCKRTKKAINARNRQAKKVGKELPPNDQVELERTTQEQAILNKQIDGMRKQLRHHQMVTQDYRTKRTERFGGDSSAPPQPPDVQSTPHPQPRIPSGASTRLPQSARQEYDAYMIQKIRQQQQQQQIQGPRPPVQIVGDNNPFSEGYQEREKMEKTHTEGMIPVMPPTESGDQSEIPRQVPFYGERTMSFDQGMRLPASSGEQQRYHLQGPVPVPVTGPGPGPRFADPSLMGGDQGPRLPLPAGYPGPMGFRPGAPPYSQGPAQNTAPMEPRPPVHFTPQSETEKRIMEILESTAGLQRRQGEKQETDKEPSSKPGTPGKSVAQKETKMDTSSTREETGTTQTQSTTEAGPTSSGAGSKSIEQSTSEKRTILVQATSANMNLPSNAELSRESEDSQDSEPILPMNVMIHQQSMPHRVSMPQMFNGTSAPPQTVSGKQESQQQSDTAHPEDTVRSTSSSPRGAPSSNSPRVPTPQSVEIQRSTSVSPRVQQSHDGVRSTSSSPRIPHSPSPWQPPEMYRQGVGPRYQHPPEGHRSGSSSPRVSEIAQKSINSPRVASAPSPKDIQRTVPSPRMTGQSQIEPQRPGSASSDTSRTGSPRVPVNQSPTGHPTFPADQQMHQGMPPGGFPGATQSHFMPRTSPHPMPPRSKSPGRASPRQSQPSPMSETQITQQSQSVNAQFQGRKSPGQGIPHHSLGRGMPHYPPSSLPVSFQNMGIPPRPGIMQHSLQNRFQQPPSFPNARPQFGSDGPPRPNQFGPEQTPRLTQFGPEQMRHFSHRYMYPYPQSVTSSLAASTLAQLPRFTAKVTSSESVQAQTSQPVSSEIPSTTVVTSSPAINASESATPRTIPDNTGLGQSDPVASGVRQEQTSVSQPIMARSNQHISQQYTSHIPPHSMSPYSQQTSQVTQSHSVNEGRPQFSSMTFSTQGTVQPGSSQPSVASSVSNFPPNLQTGTISNQNTGAITSQNVSKTVSNTVQGTSADTVHKNIPQPIISESSNSKSQSEHFISATEASQTQTSSGVTMATDSTNQTIESSEKNAGSEPSQSTR